VSAVTAGAQAPAVRDTTIDAAVRTQTIAALIQRLDAGYVFPEKATEMARDLERRQGRGEYNGLTGARAFAESLTTHLQNVSRDKHLRVTVNPPPSPGGQAGGPPPSLENFGIGKPQRLEGNVAYLELRTFGVEPAAMQDALADAMSAVADADALIIDVRRNNGGSPFAVALVSSYLFGSDSVHLNSLYFRPANRTDHFWTRPTVQGKRYGPDKPVYVLTSRRTFSAAEEFTYNLQTRGRATIVGDTTGGGAHPGGRVRLNAIFGVFVPSGRAINPITKTNWEGTGVRPDIAVPSDQARDTAYRAALKALKRGG
jgi:retinol-binding protein 3